MKVTLKLSEKKYILGYINPAIDDKFIIDEYKINVDLTTEELLSIVYYKTQYIDGKILQNNIFSTEYIDPAIKDALNSELIYITEWFTAYDLQVNEYNRDIRLSMTPDIHINGITYATIEELDDAAVKYKTRIKEIKSQI